MGRRRKRSKTPSGGNSAPPPELPPIFIDRSLGRHAVAQRLREAGCTVHTHDDYFSPTAPDTEWLSEIGRRGWVLLTKDKWIRTRILERRALIGAKAIAFTIGRGDARGDQLADACVTALPALRHTVEALGRPLIAMVTLRGKVNVLEAKRKTRRSGKRQPKKKTRQR